MSIHTPDGVELGSYDESGTYVSNREAAATVVASVLDSIRNSHQVATDQDLTREAEYEADLD